ncbi:MAG: GntR family transcriptional regulator, partial [Lentisphaeria bacterium]|nr:GntR family transcriptional regulator [Lentisphaeria bacterium]
MLKYEETRLRILDYIRRQRLHPGDPLPSQLDLVKICNCSLITVKRALSHLQRTGIIERSQG